MRISVIPISGILETYFTIKECFVRILVVYTEVEERKENKKIDKCAFTGGCKDSVKTVFRY